MKLTSPTRCEGDEPARSHPLPTFDLILAGGGLANGLLAYRLKTVQPDLRLLVIEQAPELGGATWSFHAADLTPEQNRWMTPFVAHTWNYYDVAFPGLTRRVGLGYRCVTSDRFRTVLTEVLGSDLRMSTQVCGLWPNGVTLASGEHLTARAVIDGRGFRQSPHMVHRFQKFVGLEVRLVSPHDLGGPIVMDATVDQNDGFRFIYVLPFAPDTLLIEDTYYADTPQLRVDRLCDGILAYAAGRGWTIAEIVRRESGVLPVTLSGNLRAFWREQVSGLPTAGMRAGLFHPTTGYSLPDAVRLADHVAAMREISAASAMSAIQRIARSRWRRHAYFRLLNRMLFLAGPPEERFKILRRFYQLSEALIGRFFAGNLSMTDQFRLLIGRPPVQVRGALRAIVATGR